MRILSGLASLMLIGLFTACGESEPLDPALPSDPDPEPTGAIRVHIVIDGSGTDRDGLLVSVDDESSVAIPAPGTVLLEDLSVGEHRVLISDRSPNCTFLGPSGRDVAVEVDTTVDVGFELQCVVLAYVAHNGAISVVSTGVIDVIDTRGFTRDVALSPDQAHLYVPLPDFDGVEIVSTSQNAVVGMIPVAAVPVDVAFSPDGALAYVAGEQSRTITTINTSTRLIEDEVSVPGNLSGVAVSVTGEVYTASLRGEITILEPDGLTTTIERATSAFDVAFSPDGRFAWVSDGFFGDSIMVIDTSLREIVARIATPTDGFDIVVSPDGREVYMVHTNDDYLSVIDTATRTITDTISMQLPSHLDVTPDGKLLYVTTYIGRMYVVDLESRMIVDSVSVQRSPGGIALGGF